MPFGASIDWDNGDATITHSSGLLTVNVPLVVPDSAYDASGWNGSFETPTKNAVRDALETRVTAAANFGADNRLVRSDGTGKGVQASPIVVADTTGALTHADGTGIPIQGTNTSGNAAAGMVGEVIEANFSGLSLTSATYTNGTSVSLTAGDWDVYFYGDFNPSDATMTSIITSLSDTSETIGLASRSVIVVLPGMNGRMLFERGFARLRLSETQTWYLVVRALFPSGTVTAGGAIVARRAR